MSLFSTVAGKPAKPRSAAAGPAIAADNEDLPADKAARDEERLHDAGDAGQGEGAGR